jgi:hypothetical protein
VLPRALFIPFSFPVRGTAGYQKNTFYNSYYSFIRFTDKACNSLCKSENSIPDTVCDYSGYYQDIL